MSKKLRNWLIIGGVVCLLAILGVVFFIFIHMPLFPQNVVLKSGIFLRTPHVYTQENAGYDPSQPPLEPAWQQLEVDRKNNRITFISSSGEVVQANLGEPVWVTGCESQYQVQAFPLEGGLTLGSIKFKQPYLVMVCDMWAQSEKFRPGRMIITEGPIPEDNPFMFGVRCEPGNMTCIAFAEKIGDLVLDVKDEQTGESLPGAIIEISSGMGVQDHSGEAHIPLYAGIQMEFTVSLPGYSEKVGEIYIFYSKKVGVDIFSNPEKTTGEGAMLDLPETGQPVIYSFLLTGK